MSDAIYVVWSNEHSSWWGPNKVGYFWRLVDAGKYSREEAIRICVGARGGREYNRNPSELPILLADAEVFWPDADLDRQERAIRVRQERDARESAFDASDESWTDFDH